MLRSICTILLIATFSPALLRADTIWSGGGNAGPLENAKVTGISEGKILFQIAGRESTRDLSSVARIKLDDDATFNSAEEAFTTGRFDLATDAYLTSLQSTTKVWLKGRIAQRLLYSAQKVNRFDAAATGYVASVLTNPNPATLARPALPARGSSFLPIAIKQVTAALAETDIQPAQRLALSAFLADLQRASGDTKAAAATAEQMLQANAATGNTAASSAVAKLKLDAAAAAIQKNDFTRATVQINGNRALFVDPKDQARALFLLAEAQAGATAPRSDVIPWQDVAIAFMRVPAHFAESPEAPKALLAAASIVQHQLNDATAARSIYEQIVAQYPSDPAAATAKQQLQQIPAK